MPRPQVQVSSLQNLELTKLFPTTVHVSSFTNHTPISNTPPAWHGVPKTVCCHCHLWKGLVDWIQKTEEPCMFSQPHGPPETP